MSLKEIAAIISSCKDKESARPGFELSTKSVPMRRRVDGIVDLVTITSAEGSNCEHLEQACSGPDCDRNNLSASKST